MSRYNRTSRLPEDLVEAEKLFKQGNIEQLKSFATENLNVLHLFALNKQHDVIKTVQDVYIAQADKLDNSVFERLYFCDQPHRDIIEAIVPNHPDIAFKIFTRLVFPNKYPRTYFERISQTPKEDPDMELFLRPYVLSRLPHLIHHCGGALDGDIDHQKHWGEDVWDAIQDLDLRTAQKAVTLCEHVSEPYNFGLALQKAVLYGDVTSIDVFFPVSTHNFLSQSIEEWIEDLGHIRWDDGVLHVPQDVKDAWMYAQALYQKNNILEVVCDDGVTKKKNKL